MQQPTPYTLYLYSRTGTCIFYVDFGRKRTPRDLEGEQQLLFGLLFAFGTYVAKTAPHPDQEDAGFRSFSTNNYTLHQYETASGIRIALTTEKSSKDLRPLLKQVHALYADLVVSSPLYLPSSLIEPDSLFASRVHSLLVGS
jgi:hypothetical protein